MLKPRDHQSALSLYRDLGGHSTMNLGIELVCPGYRSCHNVLLPATEVEHTYDDLHA